SRFCSLFTLALRSTLFPYTTLFRSRFAKRLMLKIVHFCKQIIAPFTECSMSGHSDRQLVDHERTALSMTAYAVRKLQAIRRSLRSEEHTSELQSRGHLVCRLLLEKK